MTEVSSRGGVKTLAIRLPDEQHAQLVLIAQLEGKNLTDVIRHGIELVIEHARGQGDLAERAKAAMAAIERETANRLDALQALVGNGKSAPAAAAPPVKTAQPRKATPARR